MAVVIDLTREAFTIPWIDKELAPLVPRRDLLHPYIRCDDGGWRPATRAEILLAARIDEATQLLFEGAAFVTRELCREGAWPPKVYD